MTNLKIHTTSIITRKEYLHLGSHAVKVTVLELSSVKMWIYSFTSGVEVVVVVSDVIIQLEVVISKFNLMKKLGINVVSPVKQIINIISIHGSSDTIVLIKLHTRGF